MKKSSNAFTMIEMVFVIVVLGILASIAIPKFAATRDDAKVSKGRADIASIRSAIVSERQSRLIKGDSAWVNSLGSGSPLFKGPDSNHTLLMYGISASEWSGSGSSYTFTLNGDSASFTYYPATGIFDCSASTLCTKLTK